MKKILGFLLVVGAGVVAAACSDSTTTPVTSALAASALATAPISFDQINTSFVGNSDTNTGFAPGGEHFDGEDSEHHRGPGWTSLMGGGIADVFRGRILFCLGFGRGPFGDPRDGSRCASTSTDNPVGCPAGTRRGLTIPRS